MYFTSGAKVSTSRSRRAGSVVCWYFCQRASVCSELRRFVDVAMLGMLLRGREGNAALIGGSPATLDTYRTDVELMAQNRCKRSRSPHSCRALVRDPSPLLRSAHHGSS